MSWSKAEIRNGNWLPGTRFVEVSAYQGACEERDEAAKRLEIAVGLLTRQSNYGKPGSYVNTLLPDIRAFLSEHRKLMEG